MTYDQFERWLGKLAPEDRKYLDKRGDWRAAYEKARRMGTLPKDFAERTMEILEGGSESET